MKSLKPKSPTAAKFKLNTKSLPQIILISLLTLLIVVAALPGYLKGSWNWADVPQVDLKAMNRIKTRGLDIPGWRSSEVEKLRIDDQDWVGQYLVNNQQQSVLLLLRPQPYYKDKPGGEWSNLQGIQRWQIHKEKRLKFTLENNGKPIKITTRFLRSRVRTQTWAIVQWYTWPNGGDFRSETWFWQDQLAQLGQKRLPWLAICVQIPIEPLTQLEQVEDYAQNLAKEIQTEVNQYLSPESESVN